VTLLGRSRPPVATPAEPEPADGPEVDEFGLFAASLDAGDPFDPGPAPTEPPPQLRQTVRPGPRWPLVACALLAAVAVAASLFALQQRNRLQADQALNRELRDVSGQTVAALTNYDYQHLDQWRAAVMRNLTGSFQNTFKSSLSGYEQVYVAEHNRGTSTVEGVWVGQPNGGQATTTVLVRITVTSLTGTHTIEPYVQLTLLKVGGRWRVDDVQYTIESGTGATSSGSGAPPAAPTTPSTTTSIP